MNSAANLLLNTDMQVSLSMILCTLAAAIGLTLLLYVMTVERDLPDWEEF